MALLIRKIRTLYPDEFLLMVSAGDFSASGQALPVSAAERAAVCRENGVDLVLSLPTASVLGGFGKKDFASTALVQRLHSADILILPCHPLKGQDAASCEKILRACSMIVFRERPDYRRCLADYLKNKMPFRQAQIRAVCDCVPEAAELLAFPENRHALRILDAMLQLYYMAAVEFLPVTDQELQSADAGGAGNSSSSQAARQDLFDKNAADALKELISSCTPADLLDISGSSEQMIKALYDKADVIRSENSFRRIIELVCPADTHPDTLRLFLMKVVLGIRHSSMQICSLHIYVPYCHVLAWNPEKQAALDETEKTSWVPFVTTGGLDQIESEKRRLLEADEKAAQLFAFAG